MSEQKIKSKIEEVVEKIDDIKEVTDTQEVTEKIVDENEPKRGKAKIAAYKIAKAKELSRDIQEQIEQCMKNIDLDIDELNAKKEEFFSTTLNVSEKLLAGLGVEDITSETLSPSKVELKDANEGRVEIKELSSGRFKGFFFALMTALAALAAWCFAATSQLGLPLLPDKIPDMERLNKALEWTASLLGQGANANIGAAVVIIVLLLIMWIVYTLIVSSRASSNLKIAQETEEALGAYCTDKEDCKQKMELIREHIQNSGKSIDKFQILLQEQNAKLNRAIFLEEVDSYEDLHVNTRADIQDTQYLIAKAKKLLDSPIAEAGVLTNDSIAVLKAANKAVNDHIMKLYS